MSRIENLANAGFVTRTGLVNNEIAEAWTITQMFSNGTITKTGFNVEELEKIADGGESDFPDPIIGDVRFSDVLEGFYIPVWEDYPGYVPVRWTWKSPDGEYADWTPELDDGVIKASDINNGESGSYVIKVQAYLEDEETQEIIYSNEVEGNITIFPIASPVITQAKPGDPVIITNPQEGHGLSGIVITWSGGIQTGTTIYDHPLTLTDLDNTGQGGTFIIRAGSKKQIDGNWKYSADVEQEVSF